MASPERQDITPAQTPTSVYRYYDGAGVLLYVGITSTGMIRNRQHNADKEWWPLVKSQRVEHYPSRPRASVRERLLIRKYRPPFNKQHNPDHIAVAAAYRVAKEVGALKSIRKLAVNDRGYFIATPVSAADGLTTWKIADQSIVGLVFQPSRRAPIVFDDILRGHTCGIERGSDGAWLVIGRLRPGYESESARFAYIKIADFQGTTEVRKVALIAKHGGIV